VYTTNRVVMSELCAYFTGVVWLREIYRHRIWALQVFHSWWWRTRWQVIWISYSACIPESTCSIEWIKELMQLTTGSSRYQTHQSLLSW